MKLSLQGFGHFAVLRVSESVNPDQFPALKAGILKVAQHDKVVGKLAVVVDVTTLDPVISQKKEIAVALAALGAWANEAGVYLVLVSGLPGLGQFPNLAQAQARLESPEGKEALATFVGDRETLSLSKEVEKGSKKIEEHQALRRKAAVSRAQAHQLAHAVSDVWKDRRPPFELPIHNKRVAVIYELIEKVQKK